MAGKTEIVVLGGGFGGVYAAMNLEREFAGRDDVEITLVNRENFLLFTPMLHEIAASDLDPTDIVNPIHKLLKKVSFFCGSIDAINLEARTVEVSHGNSHHAHTLRFDHLVIALGSVTHFHGLPGLSERALTMKSLGDAIALRNRMIALLEEADFECSRKDRKELLSFVVAGGGFAGVETVAGIHDFITSVLKFYPNIDRSEIQVTLVHSGKAILTELDEKLGKYAGELLQERGVEIKYGARVASYADGVVVLNDGSSVDCGTLVWTAGSAPNPLIGDLPCAKEKGRVLVTANLEVEGHKGVWALGDAAAIPILGGRGFHPPTAQHAIREAKTVARNIKASLAGKEPKPFTFRTLGQLASLGHRKGVAQVFGFRFSGFIAWWLWRSIYLLKLPRMEKRVRVALNWTLDIVFSKDTVQLPSDAGLRMPVEMKNQFRLAGGA